MALVVRPLKKKHFFAASLTEVRGFLGLDLVVGELDPGGGLAVLLLLQRVVQHRLMVMPLRVLPTQDKNRFEAIAHYVLLTKQVKYKAVSWSCPFGFSQLKKKQI